MLHSGFGPDPGPLLAQSPSLNGYTSETIAEIAAGVISEIANADASYNFSAALTKNDVDDHEEEAADSDFEFAVPGIGENQSPISADEIFHNGQIKPLFRLFTTNLVYNRSIPPQPRSSEMENISNSKSEKRSPIRIPLKKLMISERETPVLIESESCSSSEANELQGVNPETYCVWNPKKHEMMRKKSQSSGSSKRWKIRDLLHRSHSNGRDALVFLSSRLKNDRKKLAPAKVDRISGDERTIKKGNGESDRKTTSYLIGWFANMNGLSRTVQPF